MCISRKEILFGCWKKTNEFYSNNKQIQRFDSQISHCGVIISDKTKFNFQIEKKSNNFQSTKKPCACFFFTAIFWRWFHEITHLFIGCSVVFITEADFRPKSTSNCYFYWPRHISNSELKCRKPMLQKKNIPSKKCWTDECATEK